MHLDRIIDFWYDLVPTATASVVVVVGLLRDAYRKRKSS
jgi:hypothetical protein